MEEVTKKARASKKEIFGWAMFDFANQGYTLTLLSALNDWAIP